MDDHRLIGFNQLIQHAYECRSFEDFLRLAITALHHQVMYDSGLFFCAISRDSSFFQPYTTGDLENFYKKTPFPERKEYLERQDTAGKEALVYKATEYRQGLIQVSEEPRSQFLHDQKDYHVACMRIVYRGQFLGEVYLHRNKDKPDFDEEDLFLLRLLQPHISGVFHIIHSLTAASLLETEKKGLDKKGLCLLDEETNLIAGNVAGLEILGNSTVFGSSVLFHLKEIIQDFQVQGPSAKEGAHHFETLKTPGGDLWVDILLQRNSRRREGKRFYVALEFIDEKQSAAQYRFKFTKREADIIDAVLQGKNNSQIASLLEVSENTVKTHLQKNIQKNRGFQSIGIGLYPHAKPKKEIIGNF